MLAGRARRPVRRRRGRSGRARSPRRAPRRGSRPGRAGTGGRPASASRTAPVRRTRAAPRDCAREFVSVATGVGSRSAGSTTTSAPASSPSSISSGFVKAAWAGPRRPTHDDLLHGRAADGGDRLVRGVGAGELLGGQGEHARHVDRDVPDADHDRPLDAEVEAEAVEVGVAVVPGDELGGRPRPRQVLTRDAEPAVGLRADGVEDGVVEPGEILVEEVAADLDVAEEAEAGTIGDLLERPRGGLDLRVVGGDAEADEAPRRREPLEHVDLDRHAASEQGARGVEARRPGADDRDAERIHRT